MKYILTIILFQIVILESYTQSIDLYNEYGKARAYIDTSDPDRTIYSWEGKPLAYLSATGDHFNVYGFNGKHLGWFEEGRLRDHEGRVWGFKEGAVDNVYLQYKTTKGHKEYKPYKTYREEPPYKPYYQNEWSALTLSSRLYLGKAKDGTAYDNSGYNNQEGYGASQKLNIYEPKSFDPGHVEYTPTMEVPTLDFSGLDASGDSYLRLHEQRLNRIEREKNQWDAKLRNTTNREQRARVLVEYEVWRKKTLAELDSYRQGSKAEKSEPEFLFGESKVEKSRGKTTIHFPDFDYGKSNENLEVTKVQITRKEITLTIRYANTGSSWININSKALIFDSDQVEGLSTRQKLSYMHLLKSVRGIAIAPQKTTLTRRDQAVLFELTFPKPRRKTKMIDLEECSSSSCFNIYDIDIDPENY